MPGHASSSTTSGRRRTARNEPDTAKWPDLARLDRTTATRAASACCSGGRRGTRRGCRPSSASATPDGAPGRARPEQPRDARRSSRAMIARLLAPDGLDADGLKIDFTARTPSGRGAHAPRAGVGHRAPPQLARNCVRRGEGGEARRARDHAHAPSGLRRRHRHDPAERHDRPATPVARADARAAPRSCARRARSCSIDTDDWRVAEPARSGASTSRLKPSSAFPRSTTPTRLDASGEELRAPPTTPLLRATWAGGGARDDRVRPTDARRRGARGGDVAVDGVARAQRPRATSRRRCRERLLASADQLGYIPNASARTLKQQRSRVVGVVVSDLGNQFYARARRRHRAGAARGRLPDAPARRQQRGRRGDRGGADVPRHARAGRDHDAGSAARPRGLLASLGVAVVEVDRRLARVPCDAVVIDNERAAREATAHLLELGHRRVGLLVAETDVDERRRPPPGLPRRARGGGRGRRASR